MPAAAYAAPLVAVCDLVAVQIESVEASLHASMDQFLNNLKKSSTFTRYLPADSLVPSVEAAEANPKITHEPRTVHGGFTYVKPEVRPTHILRWVSQSALESLSWPSNLAQSKLFQDMVAGSRVFTDKSSGLYPFAQNYGGYQFGQWAGQLGDGRAITLFDSRNPVSLQRYELQLKGAGMTPYSRFADGKAVIRSCIREALISESLNALKIPTSQILSLTELPGTLAQREQIEHCAIVSRIAPSMVRFGTFDLYHRRGDRTGIRKLADYCLEELFPKPPSSDITSERNRYYWLFKDACIRNAKMIAQCQAYGFLNGVLNTDNMSILGLSIDYGPSGFADYYHPFYTPNHDDYQSRYGFANTPTVVWWNCVKLGEALGELIGLANYVDDDAMVEAHLRDIASRQNISEHAVKLIMDTGPEFHARYNAFYEQLMLARLGLSSHLETDREGLIEPLLKLLADTELDYSMFFYHLGSTPAGSVLSKLIENMGVKNLDSTDYFELENWLKLFWERVQGENVSDEARYKLSRDVNPVFVPRNWVLDEVIKKAQAGDWSLFHEVAELAAHPFDTSIALKYSKLIVVAPEHQANMSCSCSS